MIAPAHVGHFALICSLVRLGAVDGSFDGELATSSLESLLFFANVRQALQVGYFVARDRLGAPMRLPAHGYIYAPGAPANARVAAPVGFALFRSIGALGFELWLTALAREWRGRGFGRAMVLEALATPAGRVAHLVRVNREGTHAQVMRRLLDSVGYAAIRDTPVAHWFVRRDAPAAVMQYFRTTGITCREPV